MDAEDMADFAVELDFTTLDAGSKQGAPSDFANGSGHPETIGINELSNADTITNFELSHPEIIPRRKSYNKDIFQ